MKLPQARVCAKMAFLPGRSGWAASTIFFLTIVCFTAKAQQHSYAQDMATTAMTLWKDSFILANDKAPKWRYDQQVFLKGIQGIWEKTGEGKWFNYIQKSMDYFVADDGSIKGYTASEYNIDNINNGKILLLLYKVTLKEKYRKAVENLRAQMRTHPRTSEGSFWHKKIYPSQVWLDGLYMAQPFLAEYAKLFGESSSYDDITKQFAAIERHAMDAKTGLLYHGWDESKGQQWANKTTGLSPNVWARALGWYGMAMVDVLDFFPEGYSGRDTLIRILNRFAKAVVNVQDAKSGVWYDLPTMPNEPKNYLEASASSMFVYTLAKAVRKGYIANSYLANAKRGYAGMIKEFIKVENGQTNLYGTVGGSGLGGNPYRDGSVAYYLGEAKVVNDPKGIGAFINAANEMEALDVPKVGAGKTVMLDNYFNNETRKDAVGNTVSWHYIWDEKDNDGFSTLKHVFESYGAQTKTLSAAPTVQNLKEASVYIVVDPDNEKESAKPNIISASDAAAVSDWVKAGGVLLLLSNDSGHNNIGSMNVLSTKFGIRFNDDLFNTVEGSKYEQGVVDLSAAPAIFPTAKKAYAKEVATITASSPAKVVVTKNGKNIIAVSNYGKGTVFAIGDPWFYNEYTDGRKLPADFDNYKAAQDLAKWLLMQTKKK